MDQLLAKLPFFASSRSRKGHEKQASTSPQRFPPNDDFSKAVESVIQLFQVVLAEERLSLVTRYWLARLQGPITKLALNDPATATKSLKPACTLVHLVFALALDANGDPEQVLFVEKQTKRIAQMVEQFPEHGSRIYAILLRDLNSILDAAREGQAVSSGKDPASLVDHRETLIVRFTIEMREKLRGASIDWEFRDFFLKIWAEAIAISAVRFGMNHKQTDQLRESGGELIKLAQRGKEDRKRLFLQRPELLSCLTRGLNMVNIPKSGKLAQLKLFTGLKHPP